MNCLMGVAVVFIKAYTSFDCMDKRLNPPQYGLNVD